MNSDKFTSFKNVFFKSKKFLLLYFVLIFLMVASTLSQRNISHPKFEITAFILIVIIGFCCIFYYFSHNSDDELFKVAFVVILVFGIICSFIVPIVDISDETEHLARAEITSNGVFIPHWTGYDIGVDRLCNHTDGEFSTEINKDAGYQTIQSIRFFQKNPELTIFDTDHDTDKIDKSFYLKSSAFEQNPFYGYLPQAVGIFIVKLFDLNVIWMLWLARIANLICYAGLISLAIKIAPKFKIPLLCVACIPITIYQAASASIDSMIFGLGLFTVAYFIHMCCLSEVPHKEIIIFSILSLLLGLCKLPYLAFIFLLVFIPHKTFSENKYTVFLSIVLVGLIGILYSRYSTPTLLHSWRSSFNYINSTQQLNYLMNDPEHITNFFFKIFTSKLTMVLNGVFNFYNGKLGSHYTDHYVFITSCIQIFLFVILLAYPQKDDLELKTKVGSLFVVLIVYIGTCFVQLLTWAYVGKLNLGISVRYFIPLFALIPLIVPHREYFSKDKFDDYSMIFIIAFMATLILAFVTKYY